ncbi:Uncharacterised protein [Oligella urethralis]|uniref:hypothetical protein n=1 Tax=Oligella urethralis TaxID=90245 RepID=UPI000DFBB0D5|nr:hypothetical protein [Oligella urethralis]SUA63347.1 Uncharacterised protein [Oligella urethralis]
MDIQALLKQVRQWEQEEEKRLGLPANSLAVIRDIESSSGEKYLTNPAAYHYGLVNGKRSSTASGLYGILDSTGRKPGWGIKPVDKTSLRDNVRFAGEYFKARIKHAGSLEGGLRGYGDGTDSYLNKYNTRMAKLGLQGASTKTPIPNHPEYYLEAPEPLTEASFMEGEQPLRRPTRQQQPNDWELLRENLKLRQQIQQNNRNNGWVGSFDSDIVNKLADQSKEVVASTLAGGTNPTFGKSILDTFTGWGSSNRGRKGTGLNWGW